MNFEDYTRALKELSFGKSLPDAVYIHTDGLTKIEPVFFELIGSVRAKLDEKGEFNVLKLHKRQFRISLLAYPNFFDEAHPALRHSVLADLSKGTAKAASFEKSNNPPILHRKEEFLPQDHPLREDFKLLTKEEERMGLFKNTKTIGFKKNWEQLLSEKGITIVGHTLTESSHGMTEEASSLEVDRHLTALKRYDFSKPLKIAIQSNLLRKRNSFFDYGCGHGSDMRGVAEMGHPVSGWDPVHNPDGEKVEADVVNLGYVINVIEDPAERVETLLKAWSLTNKVLVVSAMVRGGESYSNATEYGDGLLTSRNTFQKYYEQSELQSFIESALHQDALAASPGIFLIFREEADQQDYLEKRSRRVIDWNSLSARLGFGSPEKRERKIRLSTYEKHTKLLDGFWKNYIELARPPHKDEYEHYDEIRKICKSIPMAIGLFEDKHGTELIEERRIRRTEDLRVYLAEEEFKKRRTPFAKLSPPLRRDIKAFFDDYQTACDEARGLLFSAGDPGELEYAVESLDFGHHDDDEEHFSFHGPLLDELPAILRVYVGCGGMLWGDTSEVDVFKIHLTSGKLTLHMYKGFERLNLPELQTRVKIDLRRLSVQVFEHQEGQQQLLYFKERFVAKDSPMAPKAKAFARKLERLGLNREQVGRFGPTKEQLSQALNQMGYSYGLKKLK